MKKLLIAVAIQEEKKPVKKGMKGVAAVKGRPEFTDGTIEGYPVRLVLTSMGMDAALKSAEAAIKAEEYGGVLVLGYCGGLSLALHVGDCVLASRVSSHKDKTKTFQMDTKLVEKMGKGIIGEGVTYRAVPLITVTQVVETPDEKRKLYEETFAEAVDMESSEIVGVALNRDMKAAVMKIVIDDVETELPHFNDYFNKTGKMDHLGVGQVMMASPGLSMQLSKNMKKCGVILEKVLPVLVSLACEEWKIAKVAQA